MLIISSLTLLIPILPLFVAACLDPRFQDEQVPFVTIPLVERNLTLPNGVLDIEAIQRPILAPRNINRMRKKAINLKRRWFTERLEKIIMRLRREGQEKNLIFTSYDRPFTGKITIGNPPHTFYVGFSTASSISQILIYDRRAQDAYEKNKKDFKNIYMPQDSTTYENWQTINEKGFRDTMTFAKITVKGQYFYGIESFHRDGTIALGFSGYGSPATFLDLALDQRKISQKVFGVTLDRSTPEYHIGGLNTKLYTDPHYHNVIQPVEDDGVHPYRYWLLGNAQVFVDEKPVFKIDTVISTDSVRTWGPSAQVREFYKRFIPDAKEKNGIYNYPCDQAPKVKISWDGKEPWIHDFSLGYADLKWKRCYGAIGAYDPGSKKGIKNQWILGARILQNMYVGFINTGNNPQVMFGKLRKQD